MSWISAEEAFDLYSQDEYWIDRNRKKHLLSEIDDSYLRNLRGFVLKYMSAHCRAAAWHLEAPNLNGDMAQMIAERGWYQAMDALYSWAENPESCPLVRGIDAELTRRHSFPHLRVSR